MRDTSGKSGRAYEELWEKIPVMFHVSDSQGKIVQVSDHWLKSLGYQRDEVVGRSWDGFIHAADRKGVPWSLISRASEAELTEMVACNAFRRDGSAINIVMSSARARDPLTGNELWLSVMNDVTEESRHRAVIASQNELFRVTLRSIGDGVIRTDAHGQVNYLNPVAEKLTGWTSDAAYGKSVELIFRVLNRETRQRAKSPVAQCILEDRPISLPVPRLLISQDRTEYFVKESVSPIKDDLGATVGIVLVFYDTSEQQRLNDEIRYRATHDTMTGLFNRDEFERHLKELLAEAQKTKAQHALLYIDLDQFKLVNDAAGHIAGDQLLKQIAFIIETTAGRTGIAARVGGDEFALLITHRSVQRAERLARRLCERIDSFRFQFDGQKFHVGASIGLVAVDQHWPDAESILRAADGACFAAKEGGRNRFHTYRPTDHVIGSHQQAMRWVRQIEQALDGDRFVLHWQSIVPMESSVEGVHCEILLRMVGEDGKLIAPGAFLPSAERFGIASRVDQWVLKTMLTWMAENRSALAHVDTISINLSGRSIGDRKFHQQVIGLLNETGAESKKLCFEITETAAITNICDATAFFETMRAHGVRFSLDDFGSGVSSFGYLKTLPVDYLKIDGQFIRNLIRDKVDYATVRCIHEIAKITGKKTIAEFVETEEVEQLLRIIGIDYVQGFLRHRPSPLSQLLFSEPRR